MEQPKNSIGVRRLASWTATVVLVIANIALLVTYPVADDPDGLPSSGNASTAVVDSAPSSGDPLSHVELPAANPKKIAAIASSSEPAARHVPPRNTESMVVPKAFLPLVFARPVFDERGDWAIDESFVIGNGISTDNAERLNSTLKSANDRWRAAEFETGRVVDFGEGSAFEIPVMPDAQKQVLRELEAGLSGILDSASVSVITNSVRAHVADTLSHRRRIWVDQGNLVVQKIHGGQVVDEERSPISEDDHLVKRYRHLVEFE